MPSPSFPRHIAHISMAAFLAFGCARSPIGLLFETRFDLYFLDNDLHFLENYLCDLPLGIASDRLGERSLRI